MFDFISFISSQFPYPVSENLINFRILIYSGSLFFISIILLIFYVKTKRDVSNPFMKKLSRSYWNSLVGLGLINLNFFLTSLSLLLTHGKIMIFGNEKSFFYLLGNLMFFFGIMKVSLNIISFTKFGRKLYILFSYSVIAIGILGFMMIFSEIYLHNSNKYLITGNFVLKIFGMLYLLLLLVSLVALTLERKNNPSKIELMRINFLSLILLLQTSQLILRLLILFFQNNQFVSVYLIFFISPILDFAVIIVCAVLFYWSIYTPTWVMIKFSVIPKGYQSVI